MYVIVKTINRDLDVNGKQVVESTKVIDYNDSSDRKWLRNHCVWAFHNNRRVSTELKIN